MSAVLKHQLDQVRIGGLALTSRLFAPTNITHESDLCIENLETELSAELVVRSDTQVLIRLAGDRSLGIDHSMLKRLRFSDISGLVHLGHGRTQQVDVPLFDAIHKRLLAARISRSYLLMVNTSRCETAEQAINMAGWGMYATRSPYVKLEIRDPATLMTRNDAIVAAAHAMVDLVPDIRLLPLIGKVPDVLDELQSIPQVVAIRVEGSQPGSGRGLGNEAEMEILRSMIRAKRVPLVAECGIGVPAHAEQAMTMGFDAALINAAITRAQDPVAMAMRFADAVQRGRRSYLNKGH